MNCLKEYDEFGVWEEQLMRFKAAHIYFFHIVDWKNHTNQHFFCNIFQFWNENF